MKKVFLNLLAVVLAITFLFFLAMPAKAQNKKQMIAAINALDKNAKAQAEAIENLQAQSANVEKKIDNLNPDKIMGEFHLKLAEVIKTTVAAMKAELDKMKPAEESAKTGTEAPAGKPGANATASPKPAALLKVGQVKYDSNTKEAVCLPGDTLAASNIRPGFTKREDKSATRALKGGQFLEDYSSKGYRRLTSDTEVTKKYPVPSGYKEGTDPR